MLLDIDCDTNDFPVFPDARHDVCCPILPHAGVQGRYICCEDLGAFATLSHLAVCNSSSNAASEEICSPAGFIWFSTSEMLDHASAMQLSTRKSAASSSNMSSIVTVTPPLWIPGPRRIRPPQANWRRHGPEHANKPKCTCNATQPNQRESNATQRNPCLERPACQRQTMQSHESIQRAARTMQPYQGPANAQLASLHAECDLLGQMATAAFGDLLCAQPQHG
jgi:hypothetical protein